MEPLDYVAPAMLSGFWGNVILVINIIGLVVGLMAVGHLRNKRMYWLLMMILASWFALSLMCTIGVVL
jgi:hypothetical protein